MNALKPRRVKALQITPWAIYELLRQHLRDVPEASEVVHAFIDPYTGNVSLLLQHDSFPEVHEAQPVEVVHPRYYL